MFGKLYKALEKNTFFYVKIIIDKTENEAKNFTIFLVSTVVFLFLSAIFFHIFLRKVTKSREEVLKIFLHIQEKTVHKYNKKCENFISNL